MFPANVPYLNYNIFNRHMLNASTCFQRIRSPLAESAIHTCIIPYEQLKKDEIYSEVTKKNSGYFQVNQSIQHIGHYK